MPRKPTRGQALKRLAEIQKKIDSMTAEQMKQLCQELNQLPPGTYEYMEARRRATLPGGPWHIIGASA